MTLQMTVQEVRNVTIEALRNTDGFDEFDRRIGSCCAAFEDGHDSLGRGELAGMAGPLRDFARFCSVVVDNCGHDLQPETVQRLAAANRLFEQAIQSVVDEAEERNFLGASDACRFDLSDAMHEYRAIFETMATELEQAS